MRKRTIQMVDMTSSSKHCKPDSNQRYNRKNRIFSDDSDTSVDDTDNDKDFNPNLQPYVSNESDLSGHEDEIHTLMQDSYFISNMVNESSNGLLQDNLEGGTLTLLNNLSPDQPIVLCDDTRVSPEETIQADIGPDQPIVLCDDTRVSPEETIQANIDYEVHDGSLQEAPFRNTNDSEDDIVTQANEHNINTDKPFGRKIRKLRTTNRQKGLPYVTAKGKSIPGRSNEKPLQECRLNCKSWLEPHKNTIFNEYWSLGCHTRRLDYIAAAVTKTKTVVTRKRVDTSLKERNVTYHYYFTIDGNRKKCCKKCFLITLDEKEKFVRTVLENKYTNSVTGITKKDQRGLGPSPNKKTEAAIIDVHKHILSFPAYESHYTRKTNNKKYLASHLNLKKMYELYRLTTSEPVGRTIYEREFKTTNLSFKVRKADTCHKCDSFKMRIEMEQNAEIKINLINERDKHVKNADDAYSYKRLDKEKSKLDSTNICITFDLQQCLPTPFLETSVAFYKRLYWTYNLTTHNLASGQASCYLWHEEVARRGGNEIASCVFKDLMKLPDTIKTVTLYSDSCAGQNKNSHMVSMFFALLSKKKTLKEINHKFLEPGHTHMECDCDHSLIEKQKKKSETIVAHPRDWATLISCTNKKKPFHVDEMKQSEIYDFGKIVKGPLVMRKTNEDGNKFIWHDVSWVRYCASMLGKLLYKTSLNEEEEFKTLNMIRRGSKNMANIISLDPAYDGPLPISKEKKKDLIDLLPLIPNIYHAFYKNLKDDQNEDASYDPDLSESD